MNQENFQLLAAFVGKSYANQATQSRKTREKAIKSLLSSRSLPNDPWDPESIELFLRELSVMDSNNFQNRVGVGEREARVYSSLVRSRHFGLGHGIGRSGDIAAIQPKAAGSSLINKITNSMMRSLIKKDIPSVQACIVLPMATGMGMFMTLRTLRERRPKAKYVIWPRIDQKTCLKCIHTAGFEAIVVENVKQGDEVTTDLAKIAELIETLGPESILCILTTNSCFIPRVPDQLLPVARLCEKLKVPHVVNNAYGVQCIKSMRQLNKACSSGRVDAFVQSTDKNFMVPVGGSVVASHDKNFILELSKLYPGRASMAPILDIFITLLSMGWSEWNRLRQTQHTLQPYIIENLREVAKKHGERVLDTPHNPISIGMTLDSIPEPTYFGSMLFARNCSGARVIVQGQSKSIGKFSFANYGSHFDGYPHAYLTVACSIGQTKEEVDDFLSRLDKTLTAHKKKIAKKKKTKQKVSEQKREEEVQAKSLESMPDRISGSSEI